MEKTIAAFTIVTFLLFTVSTATIASDPVVLSDLDLVLLSEVTVADSDVITPAEKPKLASEETDGNDRLPESEKTQTFNVIPIEPSLPLMISRSHPIQRHSFDRSTRIPLRFVRRHPCRKFKKTFMIPNKRSYGNDMILSDKTTSVDLETIGDQVPTKFLEFKHKYGHRHHHYHHDKNEKFETKHEFHEKKKREQKGGFMRRVRKFLKHTFD